MTLKFQGHNASGLARGGIMGRAADLLIAGELDPVAELGGHLAGFGFRTRHCSLDTVGEELSARPYDAVVTLGRLDKRVFHPGVVHVHVGDAGEQTPDAVLLPPAHPIQVAARVRSLLRLSVIEHVAALRRADAQLAGAPVQSGKGPKARSSILYVGAPDPAFMRLQHALSGTGTDVIAAFSTFNAFDYLHERAFDAVVLNTHPDPDLAHTVCSAMRRNTRLYHTPALLLTRSEVYGSADEAFARGASDILPAKAQGAELRQRVMALAAERQRRRSAKALLEACRQPVLLDEGSDLYKAEFGRAHLKSLVQAAGDHGSRLCLVALGVTTPPAAGDPDGKTARHALDQFASMLRHCVRAEDLAVRYDASRFYLALPGTTAEEAANVASRVSAIAECTAYEGVDPLSPFRVEIRHAVEEWRAGESADGLRERVFGLIQRNPIRLVAS